MNWRQGYLEPLLKLPRKDLQRFAHDTTPVIVLGADTDKRVAALRQVAAETGATVNQIVLAWMLHSEPVVIPLIAASSKEHLQENLDAVTVTLTADQMATLNNAGV